MEPVVPSPPQPALKRASDQRLTTTTTHRHRQSISLPNFPAHALRSHLQPTRPPPTISLVKLQQGQIWNQGDLYLLILHLERLEVKYKSFKNLATRKGPHHHVSKKEFCRLLKHATLLSPEEIEKARTQ